MSTFRFEDPQMAPISRATWAACQARIAELEADNAYLKQREEALVAGYGKMTRNWRSCRDRLTAVIALCDGPHDNCGGYREDALNETGCYVSPALRAIRAAATGGTT